MIMNILEWRVKMKNPLVQTVSKWMLRAYIAWSVCADVILIGGIVYLIFF